MGNAPMNLQSAVVGDLPPSDCTVRWEHIRTVARRAKNGQPAWPLTSLGPIRFS